MKGGGLPKPIPSGCPSFFTISSLASLPMSIKRLGPYLIQDVLGRGGMGTVFRATDETNNNDEVAVKVLSAAYADDDHFRSRFESEIQTLLQLDHPNIVRLLGHGEEDGNLFFVMQLVKGKSLHALQKTGHRFLWPEVIGIAMDVCAGLQHAHYRGIVHRDIKPANLIQAEDGTTKITDFGIATLFGAARLTAHGGAIGTADFMSPEQAQGKLVSERSDLFSLGCVLYALLSGRPPFAEKNVQSTIQSLNTRDPSPLRKLAPDVPQEFEELINRLLEKKPENRFGTAQALNRRLVDMLELIKAEAEAQTAVSVELDDDSDEYILAPDDVTVASNDFTQEIGVDTIPVPTSVGASQAADQTVVEPKEDFYKVVERKKKSSADEADRHSHGPVWPYLAGMVVVLGLIIWGMTGALFSSLSAEELFQKISESELPQQDDCEEFLERFPDDKRVDRVQSILTEIESRKLEKQLTIKKRIRGVKSLYPIEILLLDAIEIRKDNPVLAIQKLDALIGIYDGDEDLTAEESEVFASAVFHRRRIQSQADSFIEKNKSDVERALKRALAFTAQGLPSKARAIYNGIILSYAGQDWAVPLVRDAKAELAKVKDVADTAEKTE